VAADIVAGAGVIRIESGCCYSDDFLAGLASKAMLRIAGHAAR